MTRRPAQGVLALVRVAQSVPVALVAAALCGCGARSGLFEADRGTDGSLSDAGQPRDAAVELDASVELLACDGRPLARPGSVTAASLLPRMHALGVLIDDPLGILIVGGLIAASEDATEMAFLDLASGTTQALPITGDQVLLPGREGVAVLIPDGPQVVVIGGAQADGAPMDQVFELTGEVDSSGIRGVVTHLLAPFPAGPVRGHVAVWDPVGHRVVVHGGTGSWDGPVPRGTTRALDWDGTGTSWYEIVSAEGSPPGAGTRAMGYDPVRHRAIEITDDEDGEGLGVYALTLDVGRERWSRLGGIDFAPSTRGEMLWDETACGFHLLSACRTRCVLEHWILTVDEDGIAAVYRGELDLSPSHFVASSTFVAARSELVVYGSEDCESVLTPNLAAHEIALVR